MSCEFVSMVLAFALRAFLWLAVWSTLGDDFPIVWRILLAWLIGDMFARLLMKLFQNNER